MIRAAFLVLAVASTPALAAPQFEAQPDAAPAAARFVLRDTLWTCGASGCLASTGNSRPAVVCAVLAKEVGTLRSFSFAGEALSAEALAKCNARARAGAAEPVRTAASN